MLIERERFLVVAAALAACHPSVVEAPPPAAKASTIAIAAPAPAAPPPRDLGRDSCAALLAGNDALLAHPTGKCTGFEAQESDVRAALAKSANAAFFHYCHRGEKGTWAVVLATVSLDAPTGEAGGCGWSAAYQLVYQADPRANVRDGVASARRTWEQFPDVQSEVSEPRPFDYDGDGHDELIVATSSWANGDGDHTWVEVLQSDARAQAIAPYKVPFPYDGVVDADDDGRPDLLQGTFFTSDALVCGLGTHSVNGAALLLHSLPDGTFSRSDAVARRWAMTKCPSATVTTDDCALGASCLRLWGHMPKEVGAWMQATPACHDPACGPTDLTSAGALMTKAPLPFEALAKHTPQPILDAKVYTAAPLRD